MTWIKRQLHYQMHLDCTLSLHVADKWLVYIVKRMFSSGVGSVQFLWGGVLKGHWQTASCLIDLKLRWQLTGFFACILGRHLSEQLYIYQNRWIITAHKCSNQLHFTWSVKPTAAIKITPQTQIILSYSWHSYLRLTEHTDLNVGSHLQMQLQTFKAR